MASPGAGAGGGKRIPYASDVHQSCTSLVLVLYFCMLCGHTWHLLFMFFAANVRVVDPVREFGSPGLGNVAWKERVDGWKMKQDKTVVPMSTGHAPSERGAGDIDAATDVLVDDSLL